MFPFLSPFSLSPAAKPPCTIAVYPPDLASNRKTPTPQYTTTAKERMRKINRDEGGAWVTDQSDALWEWEEIEEWKAGNGEGKEKWGAPLAEYWCIWEKKEERCGREPS